MSHLINDPMRDLIDSTFEVDEFDTRLVEDNQVEVKTKIESKKRSVRTPRPRLTVDILTGSRGVHTIENYFHGVNFLGKHKEIEDLDETMRKMQHWAHRMYPIMTFDDVIATIEKLSNKTLKMHMDRYRSGDLQQVEVQPVKPLRGQSYDVPFDEFDALIDEQLAMSRTKINTTKIDAPSKVDSTNDPLQNDSRRKLILTAEQQAVIHANKMKALLKLQEKRKH